MTLSVIISLYNYEKYIGECLDSLLAQTFQDFEVIVADDCSTDNSVEVVESYAPKFNGRLRLTKTETNSGGGGEPRNIGFRLSCGEYVFFMDADDVLTPTALEELYTLAKEYDADVVYCERYYMSTGIGREFMNNIYIADRRTQHPPFVDKPTIETQNLAERIEKALKFNYWMTPWLRLVQRKLLIDNEIAFDSLVSSNDFNWSFKVLFCSKSFLRVPNLCYIRRVHDESVSFRRRTPAEYVHKWMDRSVRSLKAMDDFMGKIKFFRDNPDYRHKVLDYFIGLDLSNSFKACQGLSPLEVYEIFRTTFGEYFGAEEVLTAGFFARLFEQDRALIKAAPAVSIIIPLYNAERYLEDCLDSILNQTFKNFEVIVVDDCSTDNSVVIVKRYADKFGGRLILTALNRNSGNYGFTARNRGFALSRGEYVFFMDADDMITNNALEVLYTAAKSYNADVVYTGARYRYFSDEKVLLELDGYGLNLQANKIEAVPELTINEPCKNLQHLLIEIGFFQTTWTKFVQKKFLAKNGILFFEILSGADFIWSIEVLSCSKRFLRIPVACYFWREDSLESVTRIKRPVDEQIAFWTVAFTSWTKTIKKLSDKIEVLKQNPAYCYAAIKSRFDFCFGRNIEARFQVSSEEVYKILQHAAEDTTEPDSIVSFLFSMIDNQQKNLLVNQQQSTQYVEQTQKRIVELEQQDKVNKAYISELENFVLQSQERIAALENDLKRLKIKE